MFVGVLVFFFIPNSLALHSITRIIIAWNVRTVGKKSALGDQVDLENGEELATNQETLDSLCDNEVNVISFIKK